MNCEICGADPETIVLLPKKQPDGRLNTLACISCSIESGLYCQKHNRPHLGFDDGTTACIPCIEEILERDGERIAGSLAVAISQSEQGPEIQRGLENWLRNIHQKLLRVDLADLSVALRYKNTPYAVNISRAVVSYSERMRMTPEEAIAKIAQEGVGVILPPDLTEDD